jgi:RNA polymerase sigma-70 factor, ECF subfamily
MDLAYEAMSDPQLVIAVARGDATALRTLYERHGRAVLGVARRLLGDGARAEEVLQDVYVRLWHRPERFDATRGELRSFLLRDGHSRAVDRVRADMARQRREDRHERERIAPDDDIDRQVWQLVRSEKVKDAVATLSAGERDAILLAYFDGFTYREVAQRLGEPEGTIKSRIRLGLKKLADRLEAAGLGAPS